MALILDGKAIAARVRAEIAEEVEAFRKAEGRAPGLDVVLVGDDPASAVYVRNKEKAAQEVGMVGRVHRLPKTTSEADLLGLVQSLNLDPRVDGILVQFPVPSQIQQARVVATIAASKDVDGLHAESVGHLWGGEPRLVSCTPLGCMRLLAEAQTELRGKRAVVVGRSHLVGKPMAALLLAEDCTVTVAHSRTQDLPSVCREADILVAAVGRAELIRKEHVKPGAIVLDVGMNRGADGKLVGDVAFSEVESIAGAITPVPGGVGPMTIAMLLSNTLKAAKMRELWR